MWYVEGAGMKNLVIEDGCFRETQLRQDPMQVGEATVGSPGLQGKVVAFLPCLPLLEDKAPYESRYALISLPARTSRV